MRVRFALLFRALLARVEPLPVVGVALCLVLTSLGAAASFAVIGSWDVPVVTAVGAVTYGQLALIRSRTGEHFPAVWVVIALFNAVGVFGYLYYPRLEGSAAVSAKLAGTAADYSAAAQVFTIASLSLTIGACVICSVPTNSRMDVRTIVSRLRPGPILAIASFPPVLAVYGYSVSELITRENYGGHRGPTLFVSAASITMPLAVSAVALVLISSRSVTARLGAGLLLALDTVILFGEGSRSLAVVPVAVGIAYAIESRPPVRRAAYLPRILSLGILAILFLQAPISLRNDSPAGLNPFLSQSFRQPLSVFAPHWSSLFGNILFSVPLTGSISTSVDSLPIHDFVTSINPLPGRFTGWSSLSPQLRINDFTPFNALGELRVYGWAVLIAYMTAVGGLLAGLQRVARSLGATRGTLAGLLVPVSAFLFGLEVLQYNLRSETRILWYLTFAMFALKAVTVRIADPQS